MSQTRVICAKKIYTTNDEAETAECIAFDETEGVFTFVGSHEEATQKYSGTTIRELGEDMSILPGLYDSHGHIMHVMSLPECQITQVRRNAQKCRLIRRNHI